MKKMKPSLEDLAYIDGKSNIEYIDYEGEFRNDKMEGIGEFAWSNGSKYQGEFKNNLRWGIGKMIWEDGNVYEGGWHKGIQNGFGKVKLSNGSVREGLFDMNKFHPKFDRPQTAQILRDKAKSLI